MSNTTSGRPAPGSGPYYVSQTLAKSASITAAVTYSITNPGYHSRLNVYWNIHSFPASGSTTAAINILAVDPVNGTTYSLNAPAARSASGMTVYAIGNVTTSGTSAINCVLPRLLSVNISLSTGATSKDVVFSLGVDWAP